MATVLVDTSELKRPTQRKLHAAWSELGGQQVLASPGVAQELAPLAADTIWTGKTSAAETVLRDAADAPEQRRAELLQQAWWARMWRDERSPYTIIRLSRVQQELAYRLLDRIDARCFPTIDPDDIGDHADARIICESMALGAKMLLTSNMRSIDDVAVNRWATENGVELGFRAEPVLYQADATMVSWTSTPEGMQRWIQAGFLACWPEDDDAPSEEVIDRTLRTVAAMARGTGGKLKVAGGRLVNELESHPNPVQLVEQTRKRLPSPTVDTDRLHPSRARQVQEDLGQRSI